MRSLCIIETNIPVYCRSEFPFRAVFVSIQFFSFHRSEESLHYGVIIRNARFGKRLCNLSSFQIIAKCSRPVVASLICMKNQTWLRLTGFICHSESFFNQVCIVAVPHLVRDHPSRIQIHYDTNKILHLIKAIVSYITHPNLIWSFCCEVSLYYVLAFSCLIVMTLFRSYPNALQIHLPHKFSNVRNCHCFALIFQNCMNLRSLIYLVAVIIDFPNFGFHHLTPFCGLCISF